MQLVKIVCVNLQHITGIPPEGLTAEEIEKMRKKFGVSFKFSKFVLDDKPGVSVWSWVSLVSIEGGGADALRRKNREHVCIKFFCKLFHVLTPLQDGDEVDELQKQLEIQSSIIEASRVSILLMKYASLQLNT